MAHSGEWTKGEGEEEELSFGSITTMLLGSRLDSSGDEDERLDCRSMIVHGVRDMVA